MRPDKNEIFALCDRIRGISFGLHSFLKNGHMEKVYENGMVHRIRKAGMTVNQQYPLQVFDEDVTVLGDYLADLFVNNCLLVELKACRKLANEHTAQLLGYMRACRIEHGLLINFGAPRLEIKKYILTDI